MYAYTTHGKLPPAVCCMFESSVLQVDPPYHPQLKPALKLPLSNAINDGELTRIYGNNVIL